MEVDNSCVEKGVETGTSKENGIETPDVNESTPRVKRDRKTLTNEDWEEHFVQTIVRADDEEEGKERKDVDDVDEDCKWPPTITTPKKFGGAMIGFFRREVERKGKQCRYCSKQCVCYTQRMEKCHNDITPTHFHSQRDEAEFLEWRNHYKKEDVMLSSEFVIGLGTFLRVMLLKEQKKFVGDRVCISLACGANELFTTARKFVDVIVKKIDDGFLRLSDIPHPEEDELELVPNVTADFYTDPVGRWALLRVYQSCLSHRLYISAATWVEFKKMQRVVEKIAEIYEGFVISGHENVEPIKLPSMEFC
jgi:hypothetical protein